VVYRRGKGARADPVPASSDRLDQVVRNAQCAYSLTVEHADSSRGDGAHGELLVTWYSQLAHKKDVQRCVECAGHFICDWHAAARKAEYDHVSAIGVSRQLSGEQPARFGSIAKWSWVHISPPLHPPAGGAASLNLLFVLHDCIDHPMQVGCRIFDVVVLVLSGPAFGRNHSATVDIIEIPVGKFVLSFGFLIFRVVDSQIPISVLPEPVQSDKLILFLCGRSMFTPRISLVEYHIPCLDDFLGVVVCSFV
jgi:hypothetical protein